MMRLSSNLPPTRWKTFLASCCQTVLAYEGQADQHATTAMAVVVQDWWWKARLGKCYYQLGMLREAEKQFLSALKTADMVTTVLELSKVALFAIP